MQARFHLLLCVLESRLQLWVPQDLCTLYHRESQQHGASSVWLDLETQSVRSLDDEFAS